MGAQTTIPSPDNYVGYKQLAFTADAPLYLPGRDPVRTALSRPR